VSLAYYNEFDPFCADWILELMSDGLIAPGIVDRRSIVDVLPSDLKGFTQCHFFAGISVWSLAARLAGWPDDRPLWTGSAPCFPADTLILTKRGQVPIQDVIVGDKVLTHMGRWRSVTAIGSEHSDIVRVKGQGHWGILTTPDHPFLTGDDEWTPAGELKGKRWRTVSSVPSDKIPAIDNNKGVIFDRNRWRATGWKNEKTVYIGRYKTRDAAEAAKRTAIAEGVVDTRGADSADATTLGFARFLGYWMGDGWTSGDSVYLCGKIGDRDLLQSIMSDAGLKCSHSTENTSDRVACGSKSLVKWLGEHFGKGASGKRIPAWAHGASEKWRQSFLDGYFEADGHDEANVQRFTTVSRAIAVGVRMLLNQSGVSASITWHGTSKSKIIEGRKVNTQGGFYRITAYQKSRSFSFNSLHGIGYVRSVNAAGQSEVYNLAVEGDETYVADGIVVHNCQPFSAAGKAAGFDDERHLWPAWFHLIECAKPVDVPLIGEQVASKDGRTWLDLVFNDMEGLGHACGALDTCAAGLGAPFIGQRLYWLASTSGRRVASTDNQHERSARSHEAGIEQPVGSSEAGWLAAPAGSRCEGVSGRGSAQSQRIAERGADCGMGATDSTGLQQGREGSPTTRYGCAADAASAIDRMAASDCQHRRHGATGNDRAETGDSGAVCDGIPLHPVDYWRDAEWLLCRDPKGPRFRPVEPSSLPISYDWALGRIMVESSGARQTHFPLTEKNTYVNRLNEIRGAGNALNVAQASTFIECVMEYLAE
jgi:intein/homing endonuclease